MTARQGTVYLVGAGPGDPDLITARGLELLERADVVLHDRLVSQALLERARPGAVVIDVGKKAGNHRYLQEKINAALIEHARRGRLVVRLKGGDPYVFGRGWEERQACQRAGVPCDVTPGISSAIAAATAMGVPATLRGVARSFAVVSAQTESGALADDDWSRVAHADTLVVLMAVGALDDVAQRLMSLGRSPDTPAALVERATAPGFRAARGELATIARVAALRGMAAPATLIVGPVAALADKPAGPLRGRRVVITRPLGAGGELSQRLGALGAEVIDAPLIRVRLREPGAQDASWEEALRRCDWVVFTSRHGVRGFGLALERARLDARAVAGAKIAVVGPTTARELSRLGLAADFVARPHRAEALARGLLLARKKPKQVLFPCGTLALETLPTALGAHGVAVRTLRVYETRLEAPPSSLFTALEQGVDAVLFASPSAVRAFWQGGARLGAAQAICIGPTTAREVQRLGLGEAVVAREHTDQGLVNAARAALARNAFPNAAREPVRRRGAWPALGPDAMKHNGAST